jgi:hypothetical protein
MPLPATHPYLLDAPGPVELGSIVRRGLVHWTSPESYSALNGTTLPALVGTPLTLNGSTRPGIATAPGGRTVFDISRQTYTGFRDTCGIPIPSTRALSVDVWFRTTIGPGTPAYGGTMFDEATSALHNTSYTNILVLNNSTTFQSRIQAGVTAWSMDTSFASGNINVAGSVQPNIWHNLCIVLPGNPTVGGTQTTTLYWNGSSNTSRAAVPIIRPPSNRSFLYYAFYGGQYGDLKVYNVALTPAEVKQNYNAMAPYYGRPPNA